MTKATSRKLLTRTALLALIVLPMGAVTVRMGIAVAQSRRAPAHQTRGVVKSFGPNKSFVNIAHERMEGYMEAMTMSFEPRVASQLAGLQVGDTVLFSFTETEDGRRFLNSIRKE